MSALCVFSITDSLDRRSQQMDTEWWYVRADYGKLCNAFFETLFLKLNAFLLWFRALLKWLALDWTIVQHCGFEGCVIKHMPLKLHTVQVFYPLCAHGFLQLLHKDVKNRVKLCFQPFTSHWFSSSLLCLLDKTVKWIIVSNLLLLLRKPPLNPLDWEGKYFHVGRVLVIESFLFTFIHVLDFMSEK